MTTTLEIRIAVFCLGLLSIPCSLFAQERKPDPPAVVYTELLIAEVDVTKLRRAGFDLAAVFTSLTESGKPGEQPPVGIRGFVELLRRKGLVDRFSNPHFASVSGRPARFQTADTQVEITPLVRASGDIRVTVSVRIGSDGSDTGKSMGEAPPPAHHALATTIDLEPGRLHCLGGLSQRYRSNGHEVEERCMFVLIRASTEPTIKSAAIDNQ